MTLSFCSNDADGLKEANFTDACRNLAKSYYSNVCKDSKNLAKSVVDLQVSFEVCYKALGQVDRIGTDTEALHYAIYGLQEALSRALTELVVIRDEVHTLTTALRKSERFNLSILDQLTNLDQDTTDGITSSEQVLSDSRSFTGKYCIPQTTKEALTKVWKPEGNETSHGDATLTSIVSNNGASQEFLTWVHKIERELFRRHAEFSSITISLWSQEVLENTRLQAERSNDAPVGCFGRRQSQTADLNKTSADSSKPRPVGSDSLSKLQSRVNELGEEIFVELRQKRSLLEEARSIHQSLNEQIMKRRRQLVESLLASHQAVQSLLEMDEANDGLIGKLIKTRPLFSDLQSAIFKEPEGLAEALGSEEWKDLSERLRTIRLSTSRVWCNASNKFGFRDVKYAARLRSRLRRLQHSKDPC